MSGVPCSDALTLERRYIGARARESRGATALPDSVLALIDTREVSGPCRGLFQLVRLAEPHGVRVILGMFTRMGLRPPAVEETRRRGLPLALFNQQRRFDAGVIGQAWRIVREHDITVLQSHGYKPACVAWCLKRLTGLPWVAFAHGYTNENRRMAVYNRLDRWLMRRADRLVAMSGAMARMFESDGVKAGRIRVIHNALDPDEYHPQADGTAFRRECGASPDDVLLGVIGRFSTEKGQALFLRALAEVVQERPGVRAALVGDGLDAGRLHSLVDELGLREHIRFTGYRREMSPVYAGLDLVVIPSVSEGLPNVLLEALFHRRPVVSTAVGAVPDVLTGELGRWLVSPGEVGDLAGAIRSAVDDPAGRDALARDGQRAIRERFSPERRVERIVDVYREILSAER